MTRLSRRFSLCLLALLIGSCSGGGDDSAVNPDIGSDGTPRYTISGTVILPDIAAVDSDTNNPNQVGWASNDANGVAQNISAPIQLAGSLNMTGAGPEGKTYSGDLRDIFKVNLLAGQVIELAYASNNADNDIDLLLFDVAAANTAVPVGSSSTSNSKHECIAITRDGSYYVVPWIVKGAAMYNLRISSANDGSSCANGMSNTALFVAGELVAKEKAPNLSASTARMMVAAPLAAPVPQLLKVPAAKLQSLQIRRSVEGGIGALDTVDPRDEDILRAENTLRHAYALMQTGKYAYVEPNFRMQRFANYAPNDPGYADQRWHYGQINLPDAMDRINALNLGSNPRPVVAVIDNGVLSTHPDLQGQIVDAYSFTAARTGPGADDPRSAEECNRHDLLDACGHGTFVSGIVAATANNGVHGLGVAPMARLMAIREDDTSYQQTQAILYAAGLKNSSGVLPSRKADVINISWGTGGMCSAQFAEAIAQARANNVAVVVAAGNTNPTKQTPPTLATPANCPGVISVGALDVQKNRTNYSAFGPQLTMTAPGGYYFHVSTIPNAIFSTKSWLDQASFSYHYGTSFSAPHVAGVIALMRYVAPGITVEQIDTLIAAGRLTDDLGVVGRDDEYGQGLINARKAVDEAYVLASGGSIPGVVVPSPASIRLGSTLDSTTLKLALTASGSEVVSSVVANSPALTITPAGNADGVTKLGDYTISVDRKQLPTGFHYFSVTVSTTTRTFTVPLSLVKLADSGKGGDFGPVWVRATNLATTTTYMMRVNSNEGRYSWNLSGMRGGTYVLSASTDLNNNGRFCEAGEVCGDYPGNGQTFLIDRKMTGLDFSIAPY